MMVHSLARYLISDWKEIAGWITTLLGIWLTTRRKLLCWPITLAADILYFVVFYQAKLLSDALLQLFFIGFTLYGWWNWTQDVKQEGEVRVAPLPLPNATVAVIAGIVGTFLLATITTRLHAALPYLDASLACFSLVASWWQARRNIANWWLWIVVDMLYVGEYIYKDLWLTAILYLFLVGLAIIGLWEWRKAPEEPQLAS
ncbi:MAG TPA: nicotinamide riboside transporter PnuC [Terracidiphilus sp.]|jgi:nicotinamide mononucleotide transporter|nr:nicotinamide riboside transporter PnuC [Terracidiphilus sp.]